MRIAQYIPVGTVYF